MKKIAFLLVLSSVIFSSCDHFEDLGRAIGWIDSVGYRYEYLTKEMGKCEGGTGSSCAKIDYKGLLLTKGIENEASQLIMNDLERSVLTINNSKSGSLKDFFYDNLKGYDEFITEFPKYSGAWEWRISQEVNYNKKRLLGVTLLNYTFTGGERGNTKIHFRNYSADSGNPITLDSLFSGSEFKKLLRPMLKEGLNKAVNIGEGKTLKDLGFLNVEDNLLSNNFRIGVEGLVFFYNAYDFGTADGPYEVVLSWERILPDLSDFGRRFSN
ncbi:MAG: DUF3298 and DUF4163 domain-containing protein [Schleiferiaceae bacterium]|nr:DUF3298 and DUF4163 domain-containing protein [Schleiferiaceae bacterium]